MRPNAEKLETMVRAEAESKLAMVGPLEAVYRTLLDDRGEFEKRDAINVAAVQKAREDAIKAGLAAETLDKLGFTAPEGLIRGSQPQKYRRRAKSVSLSDSDDEPVAPAAGREQSPHPTGPAHDGR